MKPLDKLIVVFASVCAAVANGAEVFVVQDVLGYNSWPMIQAVGNRLVCAYSRGTGHTIAEGKRGVFARVSDDGGTTWLDEVCVVNDPSVGEVTIGKGLDADVTSLRCIPARAGRRRCSLFSLSARMKEESRNEQEKRLYGL